MSWCEKKFFFLKLSTSIRSKKKKSIPSHSPKNRQSSHSQGRRIVSHACSSRCLRTFGPRRKEEKEKETLGVCVFFIYLRTTREVYFKLLANKFIYLTTTTTVSVGIEGHTEVSGPERFIHGRKIQIHASERFNCVVCWLNSQVTHLA